jgi:hypothetical protein
MEFIILATSPEPHKVCQTEHKKVHESLHRNTSHEPNTTKKQKTGRKRTNDTLFPRPHSQSHKTESHEQ